MLGYHYEVMQATSTGLYKHHMTHDKAVTEMINDICFHFGIAKSEIQSKSRKRPLPQIRRVVSWICVVKFGMGVQKTADFFGLDHSTVTHNKKWINQRIHILKAFPPEKEVFEYLMKNVNN